MMIIDLANADKCCHISHCDENVKLDNIQRECYKVLRFP